MNEVEELLPLKLLGSPTEGPLECRVHSKEGTVRVRNAQKIAGNVKELAFHPATRVVADIGISDLVLNLTQKGSDRTKAAEPISSLEREAVLNQSTKSTGNDLG